MIPLTAIPWRLIGVGAAVAAVGLLAWRVNVWHDSHKALPAVQEALQGEIDCLPASRCAERVAALQARQKAVDEQTARDYESRIAEIAARPAPAGPVRLCRPANNRVRVPGTTGPTGPGQGSDVPVEVGRDIAVELYKLADDADREALKLELLFERDTALSTPPVE